MSVFNAARLFTTIVTQTVPRTLLVHLNVTCLLPSVPFLVRAFVIVRKGATSVQRHFANVELWKRMMTLLSVRNRSILEVLKESRFTVDLEPENLSGCIQQLYQSLSTR